MATFRVFYFTDGGLALDKNRKAKDLPALLAELPRKMAGNLHSVEDSNNNPLCVCQVRADLRDVEQFPQSESEDISIPRTTEAINALYMYRWRGGGDTIFEIWLDGRWIEFGSIDFEFYQ